MLRKKDNLIFLPPTKLGFTLIETILALGIFAVVAVSTYVTFYNGVKLNRQINNWDEFYQQTLATVNILTQDLENMLPYHYSEKTASVNQTKLGIRSSKNVEVKNLEIKADAALAPEQEKNIFHGDMRSLEVLIQKNGQLRMVRYYLRELKRDSVQMTAIAGHANKNRAMTSETDEPQRAYELVREETPFHQTLEESPDDESANAKVLLSPVGSEAVQFFYAGLEESTDVHGKTMEWGNTWDKSQYPAMVGFEFTYFDPELGPNPMKFRKNILIPLGTWSASAKTP